MESGTGEVEDEDLTELDTFGGVLRSSIDDPINAFLKVTQRHGKCMGNA